MLCPGRFILVESVQERRNEAFDCNFDDDLGRELEKDKRQD